MIIRPRRAGDLDGVVALLHETHLHDGYPQFWPSDPAAFARGERVLDAWVALDPSGTVVGHAALCAGQGDPVGAPAHEALGVPMERLAVLSRLAVARSTRGSGLGGRLLDATLDEAARRSLVTVLDVNKNSTATVAFYERRRWQRVGELTMTVHDGHVLDLWIYAAPSTVS